MRFARVIIINPPNPVGYVSNKDSMGGFGQLYPAGAPPAPPLDMPYLAAYLRRAGIPIDVFEAGALGLTVDGLIGELKELGSLQDALVVLRSSLPTIDWDLETSAAIRERCEVGGLALYGPVLKSLSKRMDAADEIDFVILGEPDHPVEELVRGVSLDAIAGLCHSREDQKWVRNPERAFEDDLDSLPHPAWDLFPHDRYVIPKSSNSGRLRFLPMLTSRGCPFGCNYCPYPVGQGLKWRFRSPANVVDEMEHLVKEFSVEYVLFRDPMFSMRQDRVVEICEEIQRRSLKISWRCETRMDCLDEATIIAMSRAGCTGVNFGVESTDPDIQKGVHRKPISTAEFREKVAICKANGIQTFAFFVVGLPGDTVHTILNSIQFAVDIEANWIQFTVSTPFIGTNLHEWAVQRGLVPEDFYRVISSHQGSPGNENMTPAEVQRLHRFAQFLQNNLINRRGIFKNAHPRSVTYRTAKRGVDWLFRTAAWSIVRVGRWHFSRTMSQNGSAARA